METIQVVIDAKLLKAADQDAHQTKVNRSALIRDALRAHLKQLNEDPGTGRTRTPGKRGSTTTQGRMGAMAGGGRMAGRIARGDVRLYQFKAPYKLRRAVVLTRDSSLAVLSTVSIAPITSTIRGVPSEVILTEEDGMKYTLIVSQNSLEKCIAQLSQARLEQLCLP